MNPKNIALAYRDWHYDKEADSGFLWRKTYKVSLSIGLSLLALSFLYLISFKFGLYLPQVLGFLGLAVATLFIIIACIACTRMKPETINCSNCGDEMELKQVDFPNDSPKLASYSEVIIGAENRVYVRHYFPRSRGIGEQRDGYFRLWQGLKVCEKCKSLVLANDDIFKAIGKKRSDVESAEERYLRSDATKKKLKGKKVKMKAARKAA